MSTGMRARLRHADHRDDQADDDDEVGIANRKAGHEFLIPSTRATIAVTFGFTSWPGCRPARLPITTMSPSLQAGADFDLVRGLEAERDLAHLDAVVRRDHHHLPGRIRPSLSTSTAITGTASTLVAPAQASD